MKNHKNNIYRFVGHLSHRITKLVDPTLGSKTWGVERANFDTFFSSSKYFLTLNTLAQYIYLVMKSVISEYINYIITIIELLTLLTARFFVLITLYLGLC